MEELGFDIRNALQWFPHEQETSYVLVRVSEDHVRAWKDALGVPIRRCYITDRLLEARATELQRPKSEILAARTPDPGSTMSGDFGEILVYFYQAVTEHPRITIGPKKWRLKQDRTKPAPHSDVVHFVLPTWPTPSANDILLCSEVKAKATNGTSTPIKSAIEDCNKDRTSRLAKTLVWLKERALVEDLGAITVAHLERFINATEDPQATKRFHAVAVVCANLLDQEIQDVPAEIPTDYTLVVISVPELKETYDAIFRALQQTVATPDASVIGRTR